MLGAIVWIDAINKTRTLRPNNLIFYWLISMNSLWECLDYIKPLSQFVFHKHSISLYRFDLLVTTTVTKPATMHSGSAVVILSVLVFANAWTFGQSLEEAQVDSSKIPRRIIIEDAETWRRTVLQMQLQRNSKFEIGIEGSCSAPWNDSMEHIKLHQNVWFMTLFAVSFLKEKSEKLGWPHIYLNKGHFFLVQHGKLSCSQVCVRCCSSMMS